MGVFLSLCYWRTVVSIALAAVVVVVVVVVVVAWF